MDQGKMSIAASLARVAGHADSNRAVRAIAREFHFRHSLVGPPFSPERCARALNLPTEYVDIGADGLLVDWPGPSAKILVRRLDPDAHLSERRRQTFTIAHEIAHVVLRTELQGYRKLTDYELHDPVEERLCDVFASELLLPEFKILDDVRALGVSPTAVFQLADRYQVSLQAMIARIGSACRPQSFAAAIWTARDGKLAASWAWPGRLKSAILVDTGRTSVERAFAHEREQVGHDQLIIGGSRQKWSCASSPLPGKRKVLMIATKSGCAFELKRKTLSDSEQLGLFESASGKKNRKTSPLKAGRS